MDLVHEIWQRATTTQAAPSGTAMLLTLAAAAVLVAFPPTWHVTRHVVTIVHEGGHATVALLTGRRLTGIRLHSDTSGLTVSVGRPRGPGMVATAFAGYPGPALLGLGAAWLLSRGYAVGLLWLLVLALALLLLQIRNWYGLWTVLASGVVLVAVTWWAAPEWQSVFAAGMTWFLLLGAPRAVVELQRSRRGRRASGSDADLLAGLTRVPGIAWVGVFLAVSVGALLLAGVWLLDV